MKHKLRTMVRKQSKFDAANLSRVKFEQKITLFFIAFYEFADPCDTFSYTF